MAAVTSQARFRLEDRLALSIPEAAQALGVSENHFRSLLPELPHVRLGNRVVIPVEALRKWLQEATEAEIGRVESTVKELMESLQATDND